MHRASRLFAVSFERVDAQYDNIQLHPIRAKRYQESEYLKQRRASGRHDDRDIPSAQKDPHLAYR